MSPSSEPTIPTFCELVSPRQRHWIPAVNLSPNAILASRQISLLGEDCRHLSPLYIAHSCGHSPDIESTTPGEIGPEPWLAASLLGVHPVPSLFFILHLKIIYCPSPSFFILYTLPLRQPFSRALQYFLSCLQIILREDNDGMLGQVVPVSACALRVFQLYFSARHTRLRFWGSADVSHPLFLMAKLPLVLIKH